MKISKAKVAIYNATSSKEVNDFQVSLLKEMADEMREQWTFDALNDLYTDVGLTKLHIAGRPALEKLISKAKEGQYDLIVVKSVANLVRNTKECYELAAELLEKGVKIQFLDNGFDASDMLASPVFYFELESINRVVRRNREFVFGFAYNDEMGTYRLDIDLFPVIMNMFTDAFKGKTTKQVAFDLIFSDVINSEGNEGWTADMVEKVLRNPIYREGYSDEKGIVGFVGAEFWDLVQARLDDSEN